MLENATVNDFTVLTSEYNVKKYFLLKLTRGIRKKRGSSRVNLSTRLKGVSLATFASRGMHAFVDEPVA